ncbi:hypothetical protein WL61_23200 [Burkholderia ubonensis]|uniref:gp53-like domain-containing protein n=1 Tax=Burkholderia ubonensis TaxID=101571 RepID=UPI00075DEC8E|nr:hypothetical protein [Burkholderia ubonensis]KVR28626.1 hypothetical protein WK14_07105 [Burkholderia ubonensis]KWD17049.1 hypothetical protein WL61_23200 [Burkholderia ubonensis]KWD23630.1 hypothetical protein WL62_14065 [Burkholderia ubonensis]
MANQPEQDQWDAGVYQIEKTDPVLGGLGGIANAPLLNLANRTKYLYSRIQEILGVGKGYAIAGGTANAITCSYTPAVSAIADGQTFKGKVAAANTGATTFTPNPAAQGGIAPLPVYGLDLQPLSGGEIVGQFAVQYNASLNSGGGAFVLVENPGGITRAIAPALADNSATIAPTSWIRSIFAPLASPAFTGSPQAPVPPQFDNSTKLATTAFVQTALGNLQSFTMNPGTNATLTQAQAGGGWDIYGACTITLPSTVGLPLGACYSFSVGAAVTFNCVGSDQIYFNDSTATTTSFVPVTGTAFRLVKINANQWLVFSEGRGSASISASGYQKLPSGLIVQWGAIGNVTTSATSANFPIAFTSAVYSVSLTATSNSAVAASLVSASNTGVSAVVSSGNVAVGYVAIGK